MQFKPWDRHSNLLNTYAMYYFLHLNLLANCTNAGGGQVNRYMYYYTKVTISLGLQS